jgi:hypothetical protein
MALEMREQWFGAPAVRRLPEPVRTIVVLAMASGSWLGIRPVHAQVIGDQLPVAGTMTYHALIHNKVDGSRSRGIGLRFAGRVALRVSATSYAGFGGGSWVRLTRGECGLPDCDGVVGAQSEAFVYQLYFQHYVGRRLFLRGGAGVAETRTLVPANRILIAVTERWRGALSAGGGIDLHIAHHVYLTPSLDFTVLPGADTRARELGSALAVGLGLTLR